MAAWGPIGFTLALCARLLVPSAAEPDLDDIVSAAAESQGQQTGVATLAFDDARGDVFAAATEYGSVTVAQEETAQASVVLEGTAPLTIDLPEEIGTASGIGLTDDGAVFVDGDDGASTLVQPLTEGLRFSTVVESATASEEFSYVLPADMTATMLEDGSISLDRTVSLLDSETGVFTESTAWVGTIAAPWAADATGSSVPTHYELSGNTLVQRVEHRGSNADYPITADPTFWWGWNVHLSSAVVTRVANVVAAGGNAATVAGLLLARVPGIGTVAGGVTALAGAMISLGAALLRVCDLGRGVYIGHTWVTGALPFTPAAIRHGYFCVSK